MSKKVGPIWDNKKLKLKKFNVQKGGTDLGQQKIKVEKI